MILLFSKDLIFSQMTNFLNFSKFKAFAENQINVNQKLQFNLGREGNTLAKKKNLMLFIIISFCHNVSKSLLSQGL